jgi:hypothetical protein
MIDKTETDRHTGESEASIPREWLEEFQAGAKRPLEQRLRYAFIKTYSR